MASTSKSIFTSEEVNRIRLRHMCDSGSVKAFQILLEWLTPGWDRSTETFSDFLKRQKAITMKDFKNALKPSQKYIMRTDPNGSTWDISLLYVLILYGNEFLADRNDPVWKNADILPSGIEFLITSIKNVRNDVVHSYAPVDQNTFFQTTEKIRLLLEETILAAGYLCLVGNDSEINMIVAELNTILNSCRDDPLEPKDFNEYKKRLLFKEQKNFVESEGKKELSSRHSKYRTLSPTSHLVKVKFPVEDVFTQMILEGYGMEKADIILEDILIGDYHFITDDIILIDGNAGVGKTTLVKKILSDWVSGKKDIKYLDQYSVILHAESRDYVTSLKDLMRYSIPNVSKSFEGDDLMLILRDLKSLFIMDGLDELNSSSTQLFKELLNFKYSNDNMTLLVTTRPEAVRMYYQFVDSNLVETKHIRLLGIPSAKREEFVQKYYESIEKVKTVEQKIESLLSYLRKTDRRLGYLWTSPYNLTLLIILWVMKPLVVNSITTAPELQWEMFLLYLEKLEERLRNNTLTRHLLPSLLKRKIELFLYALCEEALRALAQNSITLDEEAYQRLAKTCHHLVIPEEEMLGIFLKKTDSATTSLPRYSFPHKSTMDFMAARHIFLHLTDEFNNININNIMTGFTDLLSLNAVPARLVQSLMKYVEEELKKAISQDAVSQSIESQIEEQLVIMGIIKKAENSMHFEMAKYQNVLTFLIGLFYIQKDKIRESSKEEALELLQMTGIRNNTLWIELLNGVKCDEYVASFIGRETDILDGDISVDDSSLLAYISLLQAMDTEVQASINTFKINIKEEDEVINDLIQEINKRKIKVGELCIEHDFRNPLTPTTQADNVASIFNRCQLERYEGAAFKDFQKTQFIKYLKVSIRTAEDYAALLEHLETKRPWTFEICLSQEIESQCLKSLPYGLRNYGNVKGIECYIPDVSISNISNTSAILRKIQPEEGFLYIYFPRCCLETVQDYVSLFRVLRNHSIRVIGSLEFPFSKCPPCERSKDSINNAAKTKLGCEVYWGNGVYSDLDTW